MVARLPVDRTTTRPTSTLRHELDPILTSAIVSMVLSRVSWDVGNRINGVKKCVDGNACRKVFLTSWCCRWSPESREMLRRVDFEMQVFGV